MVELIAQTFASIPPQDFAGFAMLLTGFAMMGSMARRKPAMARVTA